MAALLALLLTSGCSSFEIFYGLADVYIENQAADYLDLGDADEDHLERQVDALMAWHKAEMLPRYASYLREQATNIEGHRMDRSTVSDGIDDFKLLMDDTIRGIAKHAAPVLLRHTSESRRRYLATRMEVNDPDRRPPGAPPLTETEDREAYIRERSNRIIENFETLTGPLSGTQEDIIRHYVFEGSFIRKRWRAYRQMRRRAFLAKLAEAPAPAEFETFIFETLLRSEKLVGPQYTAEAQEWWQGIVTVIHAVLGSLDEHQRKELIGNLRGYAGDMIRAAS